MTDFIFTSELTVNDMAVSATDISVVAAAKVSTIGSESMWVDEVSNGLIRYLMRNRHGTPFEHTYFTFFVKAPIFVFREFHRHRIGWSYNEESARYKQLAPEFYIPSRDRNLKQDGKPGNYTYVPGTDQDYALVFRTLKNEAHYAYGSYEALLEQGIAREVARMCLPVNIYSSMYATCNARSLMAFLSLRQKHEEGEAKFPSSPMKEINVIADKMEAIFKSCMPITHAAFVESGYVAP